MATPTAAEHHDVEQRFRDLERSVADLVSATLRRQPQRGQAVQYDLDAINLPTNFAEIVAARQAITVPAGYTRATVLMYASAGVSSTGAGNTNVGIYPIINGVGGRPISNGIPGGGSVSAPSNFAATLTGLTPGSTFLLQIQAYAAASNSITAATGNVHLSAAVNFYR